jgi:hypothetical protein
LELGQYAPLLPRGFDSIEKQPACGLAGLSSREYLLSSGGEAIESFVDEFAKQHIRSCQTDHFTRRDHTNYDKRPALIDTTSVPTAIEKFLTEPADCGNYSVAVVTQDRWLRGLLDLETGIVATFPNDARNIVPLPLNHNVYASKHQDHWRRKSNLIGVGRAFHLQELDWVALEGKRISPVVIAQNKFVSKGKKVLYKQAEEILGISSCTARGLLDAERLGLLQSQLQVSKSAHGVWFVDTTFITVARALAFEGQPPLIEAMSMHFDRESGRIAFVVFYRVPMAACLQHLPDVAAALASRLSFKMHFE